MNSVRSLLLIGIVTMGIYVLPSVTARLAGSHTWELNQTAGVAGLKCGRCHQYIQAEAQAGGGALNVLYAHQNASNTSKYVNASGGYINITTPTGSIDDFCVMCHAMEGGITGAHTRVTIRVCTDGDCHGTHNTTATQTSKVALWGQKLNITEKLNSSTDAHRNYFGPLNDQTQRTYAEETDGDTDDTLVDENAGITYYRPGFYACMGCHTHVGVQLDIRRPTTYNFSLSMDANTGVWTAGAINFNYTSYNLTTSYGFVGSKWY